MRKLPIGIQTFEGIRKDNYLYVDKTALIWRMANLGKPYFLSRPRRFGKSLLISTFDAYFQGKKELFDGLAIEQLETKWEQHPVLHLDLNAKKYETAADLIAMLNQYLEKWEAIYGNEKKDRSPEERFSYVIEQASLKTGKGVVVLVDEYDKPLLQAITRVNRPYKDNKYGYIIDFANIKSNFEQTNEAYLKELNRFNDPNEVGAGNTTDTFTQVIEDKDALVQQMREVRQVLFDYTTDNVEEFSSEISTIEDKQELIKLKKVLIAARDCCNVVRTFGDDELKQAFTKLEITRLPEMIREVQRQIDTINQK